LDSDTVLFPQITHYLFNLSIKVLEANRNSVSTITTSLNRTCL